MRYPKRFETPSHLASGDRYVAVECRGAARDDLMREALTKTALPISQLAHLCGDDLGHSGGLNEGILCAALEAGRLGHFASPSRAYLANVLVDRRAIATWLRDWADKSQQASQLARWAYAPNRQPTTDFLKG